MKQHLLILFLLSSVVTSAQDIIRVTAAEYNRHKAVVCLGRGAWEEPWSTEYLDRRFHELGIHIWVDYWGHDVNHDWPWWYKQVPYYLPYLLGD